jgi:hypothetical protein
VALKNDLTTLKSDFEKNFSKHKEAKNYKKKLDQTISTADEFIKQQDRTIMQIRKVMKSLFDITEQVAFKEINSDTQGFLARETINRLSRRPEYNDVLTSPQK